MEIPQIKLIQLNADEDMLPYDSTPDIPFHTAGMYVQKIAATNPLLNKKITVQIVARDASAADKLVYELKRALATVVGITQQAGKIVMEVSAIASSLLIVLLLYKNLVESVKPTQEALKAPWKKSMETLGKIIPGGSKNIKWLAMAIGGAAVAKYVVGRVKEYNQQNNDRKLRYEGGKFNTPAF